MRPWKNAGYFPQNPTKKSQDQHRGRFRNLNDIISNHNIPSFVIGLNKIPLGKGGWLSIQSLKSHSRDKLKHIALGAQYNQSKAN